MNLRLEDARGQCYDGASAMSGCKKGVATVIKSINEKCLFTHCYGHALNLAVGDCIRNEKLLAETFDTIKEVCNLVKKSPKRDTHLKMLRDLTENENKSVHAFCPTRWTIRGESCQSMIENYGELMELWLWSLDNVKDTEMKARIRGVQSYTGEFKFLFGCHLGKIILVQTDNLSRTLQDARCTAAEGQYVAMTTVKVLEKMRNDESFENFWARVEIDRKKFNTDELMLCRQRKRPVRFSFGTVGTDHFPQSLKDMYSSIYFNALDNAIPAVKFRFEQTDWIVFKNIQELFLCSLRGKDFGESLGEVLQLYKDDFKGDELKV